MPLTLEEANRIANGALDKARALGITINVAICDAGGRLMVFQRMDGTMWAGVYGSQVSFPKNNPAIHDCTKIAIPNNSNLEFAAIMR